MKIKKQDYNKQTGKFETLEEELLFPYEPTYNRCIVIPFEEDDKIGGIIIPDAAKRSLNQGEILKCGPNCNLAKVGMVVIFELHTESRIQIDRAWFYVLNEENILAHSTKENLGLDKKD